MSTSYYDSKEYKDMLANERAYNLPRLQKVKEMLDNGEIKDKRVR